MVHATPVNRPDPKVALAEPFPEPAKSTSHPPVPLSEFIERPRELEALRALVSEAGVRLLTLTGPGGAGKTRIALRLADELAPAFGAGVLFVPLASVSDPALIPATIALALGLHLSGDQRLGERLGAVLRQDRMLLVLDNFEHVLPAAPIVAELLQACPGLQVFVTSRAPLRLTGEHVFPVAGMRQSDPATTASVEALEAEAVQLFVARAKEAIGLFALTEENAGDVAAICRRLDGLPLAIELAAARSGALPPRTMLARLDRSLSLLTGGLRDAPKRLQTMRGAIAWSHQLLSPSEQVLFRRLGVFDGGCTLEAADAVAGEGMAVLDGLAALVAGSLVHCIDVPGDEPRYVMLETVRQFAREQLAASGEEDAIRDALATWYLALAERTWAPHDWRAVTGGRIKRFNLERDNLRAALTWLTRTGATEPGLRLISLLWLWWFYAGLWHEGMGWFERALTWTAGERTRLRFELVLGAANLLRPASHDDARRAMAWAEEALAIARELHDSEAEVRARVALGFAEMADGSYHGFRPAQLEHARATLASALAVAGVAPGDLEHAKATVLIRSALIALWLGDDADAERLANEGFPLCQRLGRTATGATAYTVYAIIAYRRGDSDLATRHHLDGLVSAAETPSVRATMYALDHLATIIGDDPAQAETAATLGGAVERLHALLGTCPNSTEQVDRDRAREAARTQLGDAAFAAAWAAGRSMSLEDAIALGLTVTPPVDAGARTPHPAYSRMTPVAPVSPGTRGRPGAAISEREREVLRLIADGQTDQEIADALFLSRRTVNAHVAHILTKLDAETRREAMARGRALGLLAEHDSTLSSAQQ